MLIMKVLSSVFILLFSLLSCAAKDINFPQINRGCELTSQQSLLLGNYQLGISLDQDQLESSHIVQKAENNYETLLKTDFPDNTYFLELR